MALIGFMTKQLSLKKVEREHLKGIVRLYGVESIEERQHIESKWQKIIDESENDYHNDVTFVIKSRRKKTIGLLRAKAVEKNGVEIKIWLSTPERQERYLAHLLDSVIEYYEDYESFNYISKIEIVKENWDELENIQMTGKINLKAS